jgi:hypothetical protein
MPTALLTALLTALCTALPTISGHSLETFWDCYGPDGPSLGWDRMVLTSSIPRDQWSPHVGGVPRRLIPARPLSAEETAFSGTGFGCRGCCYVGAASSGPTALTPLAREWKGGGEAHFLGEFGVMNPSGALTSRGGNPNCLKRNPHRARVAPGGANFGGLLLCGGARLPNNAFLVCLALVRTHFGLAKTKSHPRLGAHKICAGLASRRASRFLSVAALRGSASTE